jgi:hypothetical protein
MYLKRQPSILQIRVRQQREKQVERPAHKPNRPARGGDVPDHGVCEQLADAGQLVLNRRRYVFLVVLVGRIC